MAIACSARSPVSATRSFMADCRFELRRIPHEDPRLLDECGELVLLIAQLVHARTCAYVASQVSNSALTRRSPGGAESTLDLNRGSPISPSSSPRRASRAVRNGCFCSILTISVPSASARSANASSLPCNPESACSLAASAASWRSVFARPDLPAASRSPRVSILPRFCVQPLEVALTRAAAPSIYAAGDHRLAKARAVASGSVQLLGDRSMQQVQPRQGAYCGRDRGSRAARRSGRPFPRPSR